MFNSFWFILLLLPVSVFVFFRLAITNRVAALYWLILASLVFFSINHFQSGIVLVGSGGINYFLANIIVRTNGFKKKAWFILGIVFNVGLLLYIKYLGFLMGMVNDIFNTNSLWGRGVLTVGISFITFQQISYLIEVYWEKISSTDMSLRNYAIYLLFFPKLINGPITRFKEIIPQFSNGNFKINYENMVKGLYVFFIGLFKKVVIADTLAIFVNNGYSDPAHLSLLEGWVTSLAYTFQIYFDFSGYTDMAIGTALMFNIVLPFNFNSPYRSQNIREFWKRWHITLTRFLTDYIYVPMGGSHNGEIKTIRNTMITFLLSGVWHGVGWTFIVWGLLHGIAMVVHRLWSKLDIKIPKIISWFITFNFVNIAWIFFRAESFKDATGILEAMLGMHSLYKFEIYTGLGRYEIPLLVLIISVIIFIVLSDFNSNHYINSINTTTTRLLCFIVLIVISMFYLNYSTPKGFIYNDF